MGLFGLLKIEDRLVSMLVHSQFARDGLTTVTTYLITALVRLHISAIICSIIYWNNWFDLVFPILVGVSLLLISGTMFQYIETHKSQYEYWINYFIENYTAKDFIRWKRNFQLVLCCYVFILLGLVQITNQWILIATIQTMIISLIGDIFEQKIPHYYYNKWWYGAKIVKHIEPVTIVDNYREAIVEIPPFHPPETPKSIELPMVPEVIVLDNVVPEVKPKPPTPPMLRRRGSFSRN